MERAGEPGVGWGWGSRAPPAGSTARPIWHRLPQQPPLESSKLLCYTSLVMRTHTPPIPFLDLTAQNAPLREEIDAAMKEVIDRNAFVLGPALVSFETAFAAYCEAHHAVGVSSGTTALQLMMQAAGIGPGDEVITVPNTFIATVEAIAATGATPVLADVAPKTWLMDPAAVEAKISSRTKAILPVHLYGIPCDLDALRSLADAHGVLLLEDAAQAHGARWDGSRIGNGSTACAFSFYPGKNLGAMGDGGAVVTNDPDLAARVEALRHHGQLEKNTHSLVGTTGRLDSLQAAVLEVKLAHLDEWNDGRRRVAQRYRERLAGSRYRMPEPLPQPSRSIICSWSIILRSKRSATRCGKPASGTGAIIPWPFMNNPRSRTWARRANSPWRRTSATISYPCPCMPSWTWTRWISSVMCC